MIERRTSWGYMPFYVSDYLGDTSHLTTFHHGAYLLLILAYWQKRKPLPGSNERLAAITRMTLEQWREIRPIIAEFFTDDGGEWHHKRIDKELDHFQDKCDKASRAGKESAKKRRQPPSNQEPLPIPAVERTLNGRSTDDEPRTDVERPLDQLSPDDNTKSNAPAITVNGRSTDAQRTMNYADADADKTPTTDHSANTESVPGTEKTETHTPEGSSGVVGRSNGKPSVCVPEWEYLGDESFAPFVVAACEYWPDLVEEDLQKSWAFSWKKFTSNQRFDVVKRLRVRIASGQSSRYVTRPPKYLESGDWKRPPREVEYAKNGASNGASAPPKLTICPRCKKKPCICFELQLAKEREKSSAAV